MQPLSVSPFFVLGDPFSAVDGHAGVGTFLSTKVERGMLDRISDNSRLSTAGWGSSVRAIPNQVKRKPSPSCLCMLSPTATCLRPKKSSTVNCFNVLNSKFNGRFDRCW